MAGADLLCVSSSKESQEILRRIEREATFTYQTLTLPEEQAANILYINGTLCHRSFAEIPQAHKVIFIAIFVYYFTYNGLCFRFRFYRKKLIFLVDQLNFPNWANFPQDYHLVVYY